MEDKRTSKPTDNDIKGETKQMNFIKRAFLSVLAFMVLVIVISGCGNEEAQFIDAEGANELGIYFPKLDTSELGAEIVAEFDGGAITGEEFAAFLAIQAFLNPDAPINDLEFRREIIEELIVEKVISELTDDSDWANEQVKILWEQIEFYYENDTIQNGYDTLNITEEDIKQALTSVFNTEAFFRDQVTEEEMTAFYDEIEAELTTATFSHLLIVSEEMSVDGEMMEIRTEGEALAKVNELYEQIEAGANINTLAAEFSDDLESVDNGGRYEEVYIQELVPEFKEAILQQEIDKIGKPVKTDYGYHIIRVESVQVTPYDEVKDGIVSELVHKKYLDYYLETLPELIKEIHLK